MEILHNTYNRPGFLGIIRNPAGYALAERGFHPHDFGGCFIDYNSIGDVCWMIPRKISALSHFDIEDFLVVKIHRMNGHENSFIFRLALPADFVCSEPF